MAQKEPGHVRAFGLPVARRHPLEHSTGRGQFQTEPLPASHASIGRAFPVVPPDVFSLRDAGSGHDEHGPAPGAPEERRRAGDDVAGLSDSAAVREALVGALRLDLIGPGAGHALARSGCRAGCAPPTGISPGFSFRAVRGRAARRRGRGRRGRGRGERGLGDDSMEDRRAAKKGFFPRPWG